MLKNDSLKKVQDLYDERITKSKDGVKAAGQWGDEKFVDPICKEICKKIKISKDDKVVELGCGSGVLGKILIPQCKMYVGIDLSFKMINYFLNDLKDEKNNLLQSITDKLPLQDYIFDKIILNGVTMYFSDEKMLIKTLEEMKRIAHPNATIFIGENITKKGYAWEFTWFQSLPKISQNVAKIYISIRKWFAKINPSLAGKWKDTYTIVNPNILKDFFNEYSISQSPACACTVKKEILGSKYQGNRREDFIIKLK